MVGRAGAGGYRGRVRKRLGVLALWLVIVVEAVVIGSSAWAVIVSRGRVVDAGEVPPGRPETAIVLGAKAGAGEPGIYLRNRLDVALALYREGRVDRIVNSGNDADDAGNEVRVMRDYLEAHGVRASDIVDDPLGLNTAATCRRAAGEFGVRRALIVTQNFHIARAVGLCRAAGIDVTGVIAPCRGCTRLSLVRNYVREALGSRPRAVVDSLTG